MTALRTSSSPKHDWLRALERTGRIDREPLRTFPVVIQERAAMHGAAAALQSREESLSYGELAGRTNRYAHWALGQGVRPGDRVGLLMGNRADYVAIWLGIASIGGIVALLNTNLRGASLAHCIATASPGHIIVDSALTDALTSALPFLSRPLHCWVHGESAIDFMPILAAIERLPAQPPAGPPVSLADPALLIYTSGTTGLPKAAYVGHRRIMMWTHWFAGMMDLTPADRLYDCLPLYHSVGGVVAAGAALAGGGSVVIRERFSASRFWDDVVATECTVFQYIGELCRYLVNAPHDENEARHRLRLACGNGLAAGIWDTFKRRFAIPRILEFYAATEGNFSLYNCEGRPGAIGRVPAFLAHRFNVKLVAFDDATGAPRRDEKGRCIACKPGETGEAIGEVRAQGPAATGRFEGYTNEAASQQKVLRDVFVPGDAWVRSGDLMRQDGQGFFYFVDRAGDTFRWKGENVATTEVAAIVASCPGVLEATVYGVAVPGAEGKAGMAAIVASQDFAMSGLSAHLADRLPDYAQPMFVRLSRELEITSTFRPRKGDLAREGFDPAATQDPIYFRDSTCGFVPLDAELHRRIAGGLVRF